MPLLYYWRFDNYARDRKYGFGYHLNQNARAMTRLVPGDSLWAFTRRHRDGLYVLAAELVARAVTRNPPNYRYGGYRIWGDTVRSRYFDVDRGPNAEPLLRALSISTQGRHLGQAFQGHAAVRSLIVTDHRLLVRFTQNLPVVERVGIYPEDEFEARLIYGRSPSGLLLHERPAEYSVRLQYLYESVDVPRARQNIERLQDLYRGRCQICLFDPNDRYGHRLCHGHHILWLSRGGEDDIENMVLVCPNHHAAIHRADAPFEYATLAFTFPNGRIEQIQLNEHLPRAGV